MPALAAVIPGPADPHRAEHGVNDLVPVAGESRLVPGPALGPPARITGVGGQQRLQQPASELGQPLPQRQLRPLDARPGRQRPGDPGGQPPYLGRRLRGQLIAEPLFCPPGAGAWPAAAGTGRASQIASFTSTICPASSANSS
jgi:hypothetical protein